VRNVKDVGLLVRDLRRTLGWDQQSLADRIGVSRVWLSELENGKATVQFDLVLRTLAALDLPIDIGSITPAAGKSASAALIRRAMSEL
jgi:HTH-type transcriptional regulator/antitoxin HipB